MTRSWRKGGCHCGGVAWEALLGEAVVADACNCSICHRMGYLHVIVPASHFRLQAGADLLSEYTFNTGVARHLFCRICGVKSYYVPRSNPDGISLNLRCMEESQFTSIEIRAFDGRNWEQHAAALSHLSRETAPE